MVEIAASIWRQLTGLAQCAKQLAHSAPVCVEPAASIGAISLIIL